MVNEVKHGQVTIFIILGLVIIVGIIIGFILMRNVGVDSPTILNPRDAVGKCVRDAIEVSIERVLIGGGEIIPSQSIMYQGEEWNYLCYQADYYQGCYNIHPMLESLIEEEIKLDSMNEIQACFDAMALDFKDKGYDVSGGATSYSIDLLPGYVDIKLRKKVDIVKDKTAQSFEDFNERVPSAIYNLVQIARDVVNSESQYCHFEYNGYMLLYPKYDIRRIDYSDSKIYRLIDRRTGDEFKFAVRSCAFAPGI